MGESGESLFTNIVWPLEYSDSETGLFRRRLYRFLTLALALFPAASAGILFSKINTKVCISEFAHTLFEFLFIILSTLILYEIYHEYLLSRKQSVFYLLSAFLWMALSDFLHVFSAGKTALFLWSHALSTASGSLYFLLCSVSLAKGVPFPSLRGRSRTLLGIAALFPIVPVLFLIHPTPSPAGSGDGFIALYWTDIPLPIVGTCSLSPAFLQIPAVAGFFLSGLILLHHSRRTEDSVSFAFSAAALLFAQNELFFGISKVWSLRWWCWHAAKLATLAGLGYGIAFVMKESFYKLHKSRERFRMLADEVSRAYENLRNTQEKLIETEELASIGRFAAIVSHEIRNPLGAIKNAVGVFKNRLQGSAKDAELLDIVEREINRLNKIVSDFLEFSRPTQLTKSLTRLHAAIEEALSLLLPSGKESFPVRVEKDFDASMPTFYMDKDAMKQVFWNIFMNSLQAMSEGGILTVRTFYREHTINGKRYREASIVVTDTGVGIADEALAKVFQPFFTTKTKGSGLGMSVVHRIIRHHGGNIYVSSSVGKGTAVEINLPVE